ncbi:hypothetical protein N0B31_04240 [Salinirubellus salinus]|uniref:Uncharacterized protein n=1 Tax=Salinirubellus salinus TaxID=1364945 RepID=A0A9E7R521_9EURY|nr:hypothetical protein [Salinirubellus salinus]UWM55498.1 hypothetical protein N0B31_04240 [Salinirubellus salinus]
MDVSGGHPLSGAVEHWDALVADVGATADEYRERGWTALELDTGGVTVDRDLPGFDVLVPDDQFRELTDLLEDGVDSYQVFVGSAAGVVFTAVALEDTSRERVAVVPLYYRHAALPDLQAAAESVGHLATRLRTLDQTSFVVEHEEATLFFPDGG